MSALERLVFLNQALHITNKDWYQNKENAHIVELASDHEKSSHLSHLGLDEQNYGRKIVNIFLYMFWVLKRTVSLRHKCIF